MLSEIKKEQTNICTYEKLYYTLWELAGRYGSFCQFRAVGNSHDDRLIPMLEVGSGSQMIFCVAGIDGTQRLLPQLLTKMAEEYCRNYECNWQLEDFYPVRKLLDKIRICFLPVLNPDGYEINQNGFASVRNPIYRQMLRMQSIPAKDFRYNARCVDICHNFPTVHYIRSRMGEEPGSENETKALIRIVQEYGGRGLITFGQTGREIVYYNGELGIGGLSKSYRLARHMQKTSSYRLEKEPDTSGSGKKFKGMGTPEQYYIQTIKQPAFRIKVPSLGEDGKTGETNRQSIYEEIHLLPLEYIFSLVNG